MINLTPPTLNPLTGYWYLCQKYPFPDTNKLMRAFAQTQAWTRATAHLQAIGGSLKPRSTSPLWIRFVVEIPNNAYIIKHWEEWQDKDKCIVVTPLSDDDSPSGDDIIWWGCHESSSCPHRYLWPHCPLVISSSSLTPNHGRLKSIILLFPLS